MFSNPCANNVYNTKKQNITQNKRDIFLKYFPGSKLNVDLTVVNLFS